MSRLDQHVAAVQNKLAIARFVQGLAWTLFAFASLVTLDILVQRLLRYQLPHPKVWFWCTFGVAASAAMCWAIIKRPSRQVAAVAIDEKLNLREKISTALYLRNSNDPFALAALKDAELTAGKVAINYWQHFPLRMPKSAYGTGAMILAAALVSLLPEFDLFGHEAAVKSQQIADAQKAQAVSAVKQALATVEAVPKSMANDEAIKKAQIDLQNLLKQPIKDPGSANRSALKALQDAQAAIKREAENNSKFAEAQNTMKDLAKNVMPPEEEKGPIADAQRKIAEGKFTEAFSKLDETVKKFDQMDEQQKQQVAQQMQQMAKQLQQAAGNPQQQQQQLAKQLQQLGANQQQAQQMAQQMQQAAQGNQQAQQQLQQQAQQMMQQAQAQGASKSQMQQMQQAMKQMQAQANSSANAGQMAQAAQQMAQAMQQQASGQQQKGAQPGQGQQMAQGMGQMQQQLQNMEAAAQDAAQIAAAQQNMQEAAEQAGDNIGGGGNNGDTDGGKLAGREDGANPWAQGDPKGKGAGMGGPGIGDGGRAAKNPSPFASKPEMDSSADNEKGRILASLYIKDNHPISGKSGESLKDVAQAAEKDADDEVDNERIGNQAKSTVRKYFQSMENDAK